MKVDFKALVKSLVSEWENHNGVLRYEFADKASDTFGSGAVYFSQTETDEFPLLLANTVGFYVYAYPNVDYGAYHLRIAEWFVRRFDEVKAKISKVKRAVQNLPVSFGCEAEESFNADVDVLICFRKSDIYYGKSKEYESCAFFDDVLFLMVRPRYLQNVMDAIYHDERRACLEMASNLTFWNKRKVVYTAVPFGTFDKYEKYGVNLSVHLDNMRDTDRGVYLVSKKHWSVKYLDEHCVFWRDTMISKGWIMRDYDSDYLIISKRHDVLNELDKGLNLAASKGKFQSVMRAFDPHNNPADFQFKAEVADFGNMLIITYKDPAKAFFATEKGVLNETFHVSVEHQGDRRDIENHLVAWKLAESIFEYRPILEQ